MDESNLDPAGEPSQESLGEPQGVSVDQYNQLSSQVNGLKEAVDSIGSLREAVEVLSKAAEQPAPKDGKKGRGSGQVDEIAALKAEMENLREAASASEAKRVEAEQASLEQQRVNLIRDAALKAGVSDQAVSSFVEATKARFSLGESDALQVVDANGSPLLRKQGQRAGQPVEMSEFFNGLKVEQPFWFNAPAPVGQGAGAPTGLSSGFVSSPKVIDRQMMRQLRQTPEGRKAIVEGQVVLGLN